MDYVSDVKNQKQHGENYRRYKYPVDELVGDTRRYIAGEILLDRV